MPNTNACHELFLKRQELLRNQNKTNEQINKLKNIQEEILERRKVLKEIIRDPGFDPVTRKEAVELWQDLHGYRGQYGEKSWHVRRRACQMRNMTGLEKKLQIISKTFKPVVLQMKR